MIYTSYFGKARVLPEDLPKISIAQFPPKGWTGLEYKNLAPDEYMIHMAQTGQYSKFEEIYNEKLSLLDADEVVEALCDLADSEDFCLLCYEKSEDFCHRHLLRDWLKDNGYECAEYKWM